MGRFSSPQGCRVQKPPADTKPGFLKGTLGVKHTTNNWAVLGECCHEPLQFFWFRAVVKFFDGLLSTNSLTLRRVVEADMCLHICAKHCWTAEFMHAFQGMCGSDIYMRAVKNGQPIFFQLFTADLQQEARAV